MTALAGTPLVLQHGNWTRFMVCLKGHEEWVLQSQDGYRSDEWWLIDPVTAVPNGNKWYTKAANGWIKTEGRDAVNFENWDDPFFRTPKCIYKLLRACMRRMNKVIPNEEQRAIWAWAEENLVVYKFSLNLPTMQADKEEIDFRRECCPKSISIV